MNEYSNSVEVYDTENDVWSEAPSLPLPVASFGCTSNVQSLKILTTSL